MDEEGIDARTMEPIQAALEREQTSELGRTFPLLEERPLTSPRLTRKIGQTVS
jgi:hypothetical protein